MRTAIVTTVRSRHEHLRRQRAAIARLRHRGILHVVVAMDDPGVRAVVAESDHPTTVVEVGGEPMPLAAARNAGVAAAARAGATTVVLLDVDCIPDDALVDDYEDALARIAPMRAPAVVCGRVRYLRAALSGTGYTPAELWDLSDDHPARVVPADGHLEEGDPRLLWSLNIGLTVDDWYRAGGFDEEYVGYGAEDTDFGQRIAAAGGSMWWSARATAFHQYHPVSEPPVEHAASIARNANLFRSRWGFDPMEGWIRELERLGHLAWDEPHGWTHRT